MTNREINESQAESPRDAFTCLELAKLFEERDDIVAADRWRERARHWARAFADGLVDAGRPTEESLEEVDCV